MTAVFTPPAPRKAPLALRRALARAAREVLTSTFDDCYAQRPRGGYPYPAFDLYQYTLELVGLRSKRRRTTNSTKQFERYYAAVIEAARANPLPLPSPGGVEAWVDELLRRARELHRLGVWRAGYPNSYLKGPLYHYEPVVRRTLMGVAEDL